MVLAVNTMDGSEIGREATLDESAALANEPDHG